MTKRKPMQQYKILSLLLYHDYPWARWDGLSCRVTNSQLGRVFRIATSRLPDLFGWLQEQGYIENLRRGYGYTEFTVIPPLRLAAGQVAQPAAELSQSDRQITPETIQKPPGNQPETPTNPWARVTPQKP